jgi:hypothetical protein
MFHVEHGQEVAMLQRNMIAVSRETPRGFCGFLF